MDNENTPQDEMLNIKDDAEFETALAAWSGDGDKDYMRVTRKRILDADRAYVFIGKAEKHLLDALNLIGEANTGTTRTRGLSIAATNIEQGLLWMRNVAYAVAPHDMDATTPFDELIQKQNAALNAN